MLYFVDETGSNPAPPGMLVTVVDSSGNAQVGYTIAGGAVPAVTLVASTAYAAAFYAQRGPKSPQAFESAASGDTTVTIGAYRSPYLSTAGAQALQAENFPLDRPNPSGAPNLYAVQRGLGARTAALDALIQQVQGALRLSSSSGAAIGSWAVDFLGAGVLPQIPGETDTAYISRIIQWLMLPFGTLYALQVATQSWLEAFTVGQEFALLEGPLALDTSGAVDVSGALNRQKTSTITFQAPMVQIFDTQSNPALAAQVGLIAADYQFCVLFTFPNAQSIPQWFLGQGNLGTSTYLAAPALYILSVPPSPDLDIIIRRCKVGGSQPIYAANHPQS